MAAPDTAPLVAVTVFVKVPATAPAVNSPAPSTAPPPATTDQVGAMATTLPLASFPTAVNNCVPPTESDAGLGVTVMVASGPVVTVTVAVPDTAPLVAWTVLMKVPGTAPAVNSPPLVIAPPPATTDQVGARATMFPLASFPTAVNCCVPLIGRLAGFGVTVMLANGPVVTVTVAEPDSAPLVAVTVFV